MADIKLIIKLFISILTFSILVFSITELDLVIIQEDAYEFWTFFIFMIGIPAGTIVLWTKEKLGAFFLIFTIVLEFVIFMIVDGEVIENLIFLLFAIPPGVLLKISTYQDEKREEDNYN